MVHFELVSDQGYVHAEEWAVEPVRSGMNLVVRWSYLCYTHANDFETEARRRYPGDR